MSAVPPEAPAEPLGGTATVHEPGLGTILDRLPPGGTRDPDAILDLFLGWVAELGFELFPAQEEALLELMAGHHVILSTPTGSGKSLVAAGLHFKAMCEGRTSYYTSPIKALASEKFFDLCRDFGAQNVGMRTGDASINPHAPIICCTAEVLSNMALRQGEQLEAHYAVMDEFHYFSDPERGVAWQVPLITLPHTTFLLMSATLGNSAPIQERLTERTARPTAVVASDLRPVPLEFEYRETPVHETVQELLDSDRAPIYIVNFTQRDCPEVAQNLTSLKLCTREEKRAIQEAIGEFRFDTAYGKEMRRLLSFGIGVHHAGLLPKYRRLVEQLSQQGLLKVISGTDTLGVGVNIPIRTVLFTKLCKFDGTKVDILKVRDFKQIAGRAGRKGFDDRGWVVCQAPEHVVENLKLEHKAVGDAKKRKKLVRKKPPARGFVPWDRATFDRLITRPPETLQSRFRVTHGMILDLVQRDSALDDTNIDNFDSLRRLIRDSHEDETTKRKLIRDSAQLVLSLYRAGILEMTRDSQSGYFWVTVNQDLQFDFSLHHTLSLYLVQTLERLDLDATDYALDVLSVAESILENPEIVLRRQVDKIKDELVARLKAERVPYEERMERLEQVTHPKPSADLIYETFNQFRADHPWVGTENIRPKSIGREMYEGYLDFGDFVRHYGLQRFEGVLLRYLSQLYKTLAQSVPEVFKSEPLLDIIGFFRSLLTRVDSSLLEEWETLLDPETGTGRLAGSEARERALEAYELVGNPKAFAARVRAELHQLVRALAARDWQEAALWVRHDPEADAAWDAEHFEAALTPFFDEYGEIVFTPRARLAHLTTIRRTGPQSWQVSQVLVDPADDNLWCLEGDIDLQATRSEPSSQDRPASPLAGPLFNLRRIGT